MHVFCSVQIISFSGQLTVLLLCYFLARDFTENLTVSLIREERERERAKKEANWVMNDKSRRGWIDGAKSVCMCCAAAAPHLLPSRRRVNTTIRRPRQKTLINY